MTEDDADDRPWQGKFYEQYRSENPTAAELANAIGHHNWVVAARISDRLRYQFGDDVVAVHPKRFSRLSREAVLRRTEGFD